MDLRPTTPLPGTMCTGPTIRCTDPDITLTKVPTPHLADDAWVMSCHGRRVSFTQPDAARRMHDSKWDRLYARNPGIECIITDIAAPVNGIEYLKSNDGRDQTIHALDLDAGFVSRAEQEKMTGLLCDMLAWCPVPPAMSRIRDCTTTPLKPQMVDFDEPLKTRLAAGGFITG